VLYVQLADTLNMQIELLLVVINDPRGPRFDTDRMPDGQTTHFGTETRNLPAEEAALRAGLAPARCGPGCGMAVASSAASTTSSARWGMPSGCCSPWPTTTPSCSNTGASPT